MNFTVTYRNHTGRLCRLTLPCDLYTPAECEQHAADIKAQYGNASTEVSF